MSAADLSSGVYAAYRFSGLESYTRPEAELWNWQQQFLGGVRDWTAWIQDAWGDLLLAPAGVEIGLVQTHSVQSDSESRKFAFKQSEILIGRDPGNDIVLDTVAAGKRHARIYVEQGRCFLEDLGSSLGTYCNQARVEPKQRRPLESGDQVVIFPHVFTVQLRQLWARQLDVKVYAGGAESMSWQEFQDTSTAGRTNFPVHIHPIGAAVCLEASRTFLEQFADRILRPLDIDALPGFPVSAGSAFLEFMTLCLIERVNRDLAFPFVFEAGPIGKKPALGPDAKGLSLACSVSLLAATGALRVFIPYTAAAAMREAVPHPPPLTESPPIAWKFPVSLGSVELSAKELAGLERDDVLIPERDVELLLPRRSDRGWKAATEGGEEIRNFGRIRIDKYFEREPLNNEDPQAGNPSETSPTPDLAQLPVRVHVIVAEKELTLAEASGLTKGTIVELDCEKTGLVVLAVNGKSLGQGQLVEVEGRLGVRILSWRGE
jgi:type III secretion system YscQ/HrcQ family protein